MACKNPPFLKNGMLKADKSGRFVQNHNGSFGSAKWRVSEKDMKKAKIAPNQQLTHLVNRKVACILATKNDFGMQYSYKK